MTDDMSSREAAWMDLPATVFDLELVRVEDVAINTIERLIRSVIY